LLLALVVVNVWNQFDTADRAFDREADAVLKVYDTFLLASNRNLINKAKCFLHIYVKHVERHYYDEFENRTKASVGDYILSKKIRGAVGLLLNSKVKKNEILATELLRLVNDLIDARGDRLAHTKQQTPIPVLMLSFVTSFIWLIPFFSLDFESLGLGIFFIGGVVLVVVSILFIIVDLDDPIGGTWDVNLDSWDELNEIIDFP
jgi:hypothetical protein